MEVIRTDEFKVLRAHSFGYCLKHSRYYEGEICDKCLKQRSPSSWPLLIRELDKQEYDDL